MTCSRLFYQAGRINEGVQPVAGRPFSFPAETRKVSAMSSDPKSPRSLMRDPRFRENLQLARDGGDASDAAISVLWNEYGVNFETEGGRYVE